jgi:putative tricarboxylic transport membrane protein
MVILAAVGAFTVNNNLCDVWTMLGFGVLGYIMTKLKYSIVPRVLAMLLGRLAENSLRQPLVLSGGSAAIFFTRPIALLFVAAAILAYITPMVIWYLRLPGQARPSLVLVQRQS